MNDGQLSDWVSSNSQLGSDASNLAIAELTRRSIVKNEEATKALSVSINHFSDSSDKYSKRLVFLTWVLVVLTLILALPAILDLLKCLKDNF